MRIHDENDLAAGGKRAANPAKTSDVSGEIKAAIANPHQASVQTMLEVQRLAGNAGVNRLLQREEDGGQARSPVLDVVGQGGGSPLSGELRDEMEGRLGSNFADVKVHTDSKASESARAVQANAYTVGNDVVVKSDRWSPTTDEGKKTIAHELTHVMQQREGPVDGTSQGDGVSVSHPTDRFERAAERTAESAMAGPAPAASAQLEADDDVQRQLAVQREGEEEEEAQTQREAAPEEEEAQMQREGEEEEEAQTQREAAPEEEEAQTQREAAPEEEEAQMQREGEEEEEAQTQRTIQRHADHAEDATPTHA
jgi:hypothetical protein